MKSTQLYPAHRKHGRVFTQALALLTALMLAWAPAAYADRTQLKPGWNVFSPQQDVQIGQQVSADAEKQLVMLNDARVDRYIDSLGKKLAAKAPGEKFPYRFRVVNDKAINAFALPGGFIYINRGVIEAADTEAQLAGVIGHEIGHVALRHGTNQATKAYFTQGLLGILGGMVGGNSVGAIAAQLGAGFAANSILLKYSRDAERQADVIGTQILYDTNYDPRAMSQFFEKLAAESKGGRPPQFFSSHPNPENREQLVSQEVQKLGGPPRNYRSDTAEFREIKRYVLSLPAPAKGARAGSSSQGSGRPPAPSERYLTFENRAVRMRYPDNWEVGQQGDSFTIVPPGGIVQDQRGNQSWAYGVIVSLYVPHNDRFGQVTLDAATDQLIDELRRDNPRIRVARQHERVRIGGVAGLSTYLTNESPLGGREYDWLITVMREEGVLYFLCIAPERDFDDYERTFQTMLESVRFRR
jgi:Zn-dependent protease with chaperone function